MLSIKTKPIIISILGLMVSAQCGPAVAQPELVSVIRDRLLKDQPFPQWREGHLDIHHISTGRGNAAYFVFPDGTEMMFDVGDFGAGSKPHMRPLKVSEPTPDASKQPGEWIVDYIHAARPIDKALKLDYVVISHFHDDHYGNAVTRTKASTSGNFIRTGVTEVGDLIPIGTLIDRAHPSYDVPVDLRRNYGKSLLNYLAFIKEKQASVGMTVEILTAGRDDQIAMRYDSASFPEFSVRNVKANGQIWTGRGDEYFEHFETEKAIRRDGRVNANPLSLALLLSYGDFDYFTGGDMTGQQGFGREPWFDVETPVSKAVGEVDALTLNHHGNRDATNENFLRALAPRVIVQQAWVSDQPGGEVFHRMISEAIYPGPRDIFSTSMQEETKVVLGSHMQRAYKSFEGHVVIRVAPGGTSYRVYVLDDKASGLHVKSVHGPYQAR